MSEIIEENFLCKVDDLQIKEKKVIRLENVGIVVYRKNENEFVAFANKCSHYGAPLINGVIYKDLVVCPWHGACFDIHTGDIEEFPGCNDIPTFDTFIKEDGVFLRATKSSFTLPVKDISIPFEISNKETILIIGGGPAGFQCAVTLRQENFDGRIVFATAEDTIPYDRTKLSKNLASQLENILLRNDDYYKNARIEIVLGANCNKLDTEAQIAYFDNGLNQSYDKVFIATGSNPRKYDPKLDGVENVFYLRTYHDANNIHNQIENKDIVLIGSSFIAIEIACAACKVAKSVSIIGRTDVPFAKTLGPKVGEAIKNFLMTKNIKFYRSSKLDFMVENNLLRSVTISEDLELPVDICVIGIGSTPNTEFLKDSGIQLNKNGCIEVDRRFQTNIENVFAGGDVVIYPNPLYDNRMMNISHWQTAQAHGRFASLYMLNKTPKFLSVPFFWSMILGKGIRFSGIIDNPENCLIDGNLEELSFVAYYFDSRDNLVGVATMSKDPLASAFAALLRDNIRFTKQDIESNGLSWFQNHF